MTDENIAALNAKVNSPAMYSFAYYSRMDRKTLLKRLIDERFGGNQADFARSIKRQPAQVNQWLTGYRAIGDAGARNIELAIGLPIGFFDSKAMPQNIDLDRPAPPMVDLSSHPDLLDVPRVRFKLSAGISGFAIEPENGNGKPIFFRKDWFELNSYRPEALFAVRVAGQSMEPSLWDGDLVVINTADTEPSDGEVFAINYEGEMAIKRMRRDAGEWFACSDNADQRRFAPKRCTEEVKLIGRAVYRQGERI